MTEVRVGPQGAPGDTWPTLRIVGGRNGISMEVATGQRPIKGLGRGSGLVV